MRTESELAAVSYKLYKLWADNVLTIRDVVQLAIDWADTHQPSLWISVNERLPECPKSKYDYENRFLVRREGCPAFVAIFHKNGKWYILDNMQYTEIAAPDYWMPIPELQTTK